MVHLSFSYVPVVPDVRHAALSWRSERLSPPGARPDAPGACAQAWWA